ncbi:MAG: PriCT-2 domain-containing protein, partial [Candidatus Fonsibacter sp.]
APRVAPVTPITTTGTAATKELRDIKALCFCLFISQLDNYATWFRVGMILKKLSAPLSLWDDVSKRRKTYKLGDCTKRWSAFHTQSV